MRLAMTDLCPHAFLVSEEGHAGCHDRPPPPPVRKVHANSTKPATQQLAVASRKKQAEYWPLHASFAACQVRTLMQCAVVSSEIIAIALK